MTRLIAADCVAAAAKAAAGLLSGLSFAGTANDIKDCSLHEGDSCPCGHGAVTNRVSPSPISPLPQRRAGPRQLASQEACRLWPPWLAEDFPVIALRGRVGRSRAVMTNRCVRRVEASVRVTCRGDKHDADVRRSARARCCGALALRVVAPTDPSSSDNPLIEPSVVAPASVSSALEPNVMSPPGVESWAADATAGDMNWLAASRC
jgi:hypothetical protein